ncbi:MAG TPA: RagB/SusD family nutrient uptake outer membrane protein, partial [Bacteroidales bacterium]
NEDWNAEWSNFFYHAVTTETKELITVVPYNYAFHQTNYIISYFSDVYPNLYYLRPTQVAMDRFNAQIQYDGVSKTDKYRGDGYTFDQINGNWVLRKFLKANETPQTVYKSDIAIVLYRAADVHMFLAEALNQLEMFPEALAILDDGLSNYLSLYASNLRAPFDNATYNTVLVQNLGIRRRVSLAPVLKFQTKNNANYYSPVAGDTMWLDKPEGAQRYKRLFDEALAEESCMESAGEAKSFFTMERIAERYNDASIIADRVSAKYSNDLNLKQKVYDKLMQGDWYVPFDLKNTNN